MGVEKKEGAEEQDHPSNQVKIGDFRSADKVGRCLHGWMEA